MQGLRLTLLLAVSVLVVGLVLGLALAMAKMSRRGWVSRPAFAVTNFLRGIPEFLVLLVIYYGGTQLIGEVLGLSVEVSPFGAGLVALSLVFGSYASETFRGAFQSVPKGQIEAGRAYGFTAWQCFRLIELPQIWKVAIPGLGNLWQGTVKDTALVSVRRARRPDAQVEPGGAVDAGAVQLLSVRGAHLPRSSRSSPWRSSPGSRSGRAAACGGAERCRAFSTSSASTAGTS